MSLNIHSQNTINTIGINKIINVILIIIVYFAVVGVMSFDIVNESFTLIGYTMTVCVFYIKSPIGHLALLYLRYGELFSWYIGWQIAHLTQKHWHSCSWVIA
jgi:hypothetical protein